MTVVSITSIRSIPIQHNRHSSHSVTVNQRSCCHSKTSRRGKVQDSCGADSPECVPVRGISAETSRTPSPCDAPLLTPFMVPAVSLEARMVIPMKKGILAFIFTLIVFMAAVGFGKNLQATEQALSKPVSTVQSAITAPLDSGR